MTQMENIITAVKEWKVGDYALGNRDALPQLGFVIQGSEEFERVPDVVMEHALNVCDGEVARALKSILLSLPHNFPEITGYKALTFVADGYTTTRPKDQFMDQAESLEHEFRTNPATTVTECLTVLFAEDDLVGGVEMSMAQVPYVIGDGGVIEFKDHIIHIESDTNRVEGRIPDLVREAFHAF
jgi:hypothetical protein